MVHLERPSRASSSRTSAVGLLLSAPLTRAKTATTSKDANSVDSVLSHDDWHNAAQEFDDALRDWRQELHKHPELMYQEHWTSQFIQDKLSAMDVEFTAGWAQNTRKDRIPGEGGTGVVAEIGSGKPVILMRADIDALPLHEQTDVPFKSETAGSMHACGHDAHTAMLLGAAKLLKDQENKNNLPPGTIRLVWQPAEEGGAGGKRMVEEGVLEDVDKAIGMHVDSWQPVGEFGSGPGFFLASMESFKFYIKGEGGHAAEPHTVKDPILTAAHVVTALQSIVSRSQNPADMAVVSVSMVHGGDAFNIIPSEVKLEGTIRASTTQGMEDMKERLQEIAQFVAKSHRCEADRFQFMPDMFPALANDNKMWDFLQEHGAAAHTAGKTSQVGPFMYGDDFAFYSQKVPSVFIMIGTDSTNDDSSEAVEGRHGLPTNYPPHSEYFNLDERSLARGAALYAHLAFQSLIEGETSEDASYRDVL